MLQSADTQENTLFVTSQRGQVARPLGLIMTVQFQYIVIASFERLFICRVARHLSRFKGFLSTWHEAVLMFSPKSHHPGIPLSPNTNKPPHFRRPYV